MAKDCGLLNDLCSLRDVDLSFNRAKESIVDETDNENIIRLFFVEFLDAFTQLADIASYPAYTNVW
jgi:hypothetical protein